MIEGDIFSEDHDDMLDRRCGTNTMNVVGSATVLIVGDSVCTRDRKGQSGYQA